MFEVAGITFHLYGLLVGLGVVVAFSLAERKLRTYTTALSEYGWAMVAVGVGAVLGARLYHVATDWALYRDNLTAIWQLWQGGLSIIGAVLGGGVALWGWARWRRWSVQTTWTILDALAFGVPFGQAIGRLGNWVNQELYGPPTTAPWGVFIEMPARVPDYQAYSHFHPLFAYEAIPLLVFGVCLWKWGKRPLGQGWYLWLYLAFYSLLRFGLDFLRLDTAAPIGLGLGVNQIVMAIVFTGSMVVLSKKTLHTKPFSRYNG